MQSTCCVRTGLWKQHSLQLVSGSRNLRLAHGLRKKLPVSLSQQLHSQCQSYFSRSRLIPGTAVQTSQYPMECKKHTKLLWNAMQMRSYSPNEPEKSRRKDSQIEAKRTAALQLLSKLPDNPQSSKVMMEVISLFADIGDRKLLLQLLDQMEISQYKPDSGMIRRILQVGNTLFLRRR
jgi:hypothetical protein